MSGHKEKNAVGVMLEHYGRLLEAVEEQGRRHDLYGPCDAFGPHHTCSACNAMWDASQEDLEDIRGAWRALLSEYTASQERVRELEAGIRTALHMIGNSDFLPARKHLRSVLRAPEPPGEEGT